MPGFFVSKSMNCKERYLPMKRKKIVVALGHKALGTTLPEQKAAVKRSAKVIPAHPRPQHAGGCGLQAGAGRRLFLRAQRNGAGRQQDIGGRHELAGRHDPHGDE